MTERVYVSPEIYAHLCPEGQQLKKELDDLLARKAYKEDIYRAMVRYFTHKNGIVASGQVVVKKPCPDCSMWLVEFPKP